ncbi:hypothetical protein CBA19CS22_26735 [Caballeronia novacaledonica]|uniref:Uncharacterized protein n=1 Tax=Caballeronia novacaledonica TaxID=1544861 RepID=A0ACB5QYH0_9BURK|nr:hypothetical protein CBA19CS22_26735 [Caballeronia novacaledonica]
MDHDAEGDGQASGGRKSASQQAMAQLPWSPSMKMPSHDVSPFWKSRGAIALLGFGAIAAFFMFSEHRAHFLGALPYLLFLACPLMHLFMQHGHHHGERSATHTADTKGGRDE